MRHAPPLAIGFFFTSLSATSAHSSDSPFVTLPFTASRNEDISRAFESALKRHATRLCVLVFEQNPKRCSGSDLRWSDIADITAIESTESRTLLSATISISRWARRLEIQPLPDPSPMVASASTPPAWAYPIADIAIEAAPATFRIGETIGHQRIMAVTPGRPVLGDPAEAKIHALISWREKNAATTGHVDDAVPSPDTPSIAFRRPTDTTANAAPQSDQDERISGMRW